MTTTTQNAEQAPTVTVAAIEAVTERLLHVRRIAEYWERTYASSLEGKVAEALANRFNLTVEAALGSFVGGAKARLDDLKRAAAEGRALLARLPADYPAKDPAAPAARLADLSDEDAAHGEAVRQWSARQDLLKTVAVADEAVPLMEAHLARARAVAATAWAQDLDRRQAAEGERHRQVMKLLAEEGKRVTAFGANRP